MARQQVDNSQDVLDSRDILARIEELEGDKEAKEEDGEALDEDDADELKALLANASGETNLIDVGPLRLAACVNKIAALLHDDTPPLAVMDGMWDPYDERFYPASEAPPANEMSLDYGQVTVIVVGRKP